MTQLFSSDLSQNSPKLIALLPEIVGICNKTDEEDKVETFTRDVINKRRCQKPERILLLFVLALAVTAAGQMSRGPPELFLLVILMEVRIWNEGELELA